MSVFLPTAFSGDEDGTRDARWSLIAMPAEKRGFYPDEYFNKTCDLNEIYYTSGVFGHVTVKSNSGCVVIFIEKRIGDPRSHVLLKHSPRLDWFMTRPA
jgi:hypothetical protein